MMRSCLRSFGCCRVRRALQILASLAALLGCLTVSSISICLSQEAPLENGYMWEPDGSFGLIALSRRDQPFNFFVAGNLAAYGVDVVDKMVGLLSRSTNIPVDKSMKAYSVLVIQDTEVFNRLKNDRKSFDVLGIPSPWIDQLSEKVPAGSKCAFNSYSSNHEIVFTLIVASEAGNNCVVEGVFHAFGIVAPHPSY